MTSLIKLNRTFISIKGEDAEKFLQGQVSCDVCALNNEQFSFGTLNTPKGRIYGLFKIIRVENGFLLSVEPSTSPMIIKQLSKYCVFFKCKITEDNTYSAYGDVIETSEQTSQSKPHPYYPTEVFKIVSTTSHVCLRLPSVEKHTLFEIWYLDNQEPTLSDDQADIETWSAFEALQGIPEIYANTQEAFILQYLNLQELDAVSFKKGCYTGQEIIARMKFLGKQKKMTYLLTSSDKISVDPNTSIYAEGGAKCGTVVRSHWSSQTGSTTLAIITKSYVEENASAYLDPECTTKFKISSLNYA